jgi:hypothetical protein
MAIIKKSKDNECWLGCGEKGILVCCSWKEIYTVIWKAAWSFLKKLKCIEL